MKNTMLWLVVISVVALGIAGVKFLCTASAASSFNVAAEARMPSLVAGITCLVFAVGLLTLGVFGFRKDE